MNNPSACPHFSVCSGCTLSENFLNPPIWQEALLFFKKLTPHLRPELFLDGFSQTRSKAKLAVRGGPEIGLFRRQSHEVVSIPECLVHHGAINRASALVKKEIINQAFPVFQENTSSGWLRYLQFFVERETGLVQLVLTLNLKEKNNKVASLCRSLWDQGNWHSIWLNFHPASSNRIFGDTWEHVFGQRFLWQVFNRETAVAFHPGAFSQNHLSLFEKILKKIEGWVGLGAQVIEFYAGVGVIGLSLRKKAARISLIENNIHAKISFEESLRHLPPSEQKLYIYHSCSATDQLDLITDGATLILDPPRKGLESALLDRLTGLKSGKIIYVSCGFESFQADAIKLLDAGWSMTQVSGYLLFPGTNHVEILALFLKI